MERLAAVLFAKFFEDGLLIGKMLFAALVGHIEEAEREESKKSNGSRNFAVMAVIPLEQKGVRHIEKKPDNADKSHNRKHPILPIGNFGSVPANIPCHKT